MCNRGEEHRRKRRKEEESWRSFEIAFQAYGGHLVAVYGFYYLTRNTTLFRSIEFLVTRRWFNQPYFWRVVLNDINSDWEDPGGVTPQCGPPDNINHDKDVVNYFLSV